MIKQTKRKYIKWLLYVFLIFLLFLLIILLTNIFYKDRYRKIEKEYIDAAVFIYENNGIEDSIEKDRIIMTRKEINSLLISPALDHVCNGYVIISPSSQGPSYTPYIKCGNKYETTGFDDIYLK